MIIKNATQVELEKVYEQLEDAQAEIGTLNVKLEMKEVENENLKIKADYAALKVTSLEKEIEELKLEHEKVFRDIQKKLDTALGKKVGRGLAVAPDEVIHKDLRDYGNELPSALGEEDFKTTHNTNFSVGLTNFAVQTLIIAFEKQKGGIWGINEFVSRKLAEREGGTWICDIRPSVIEHCLNQSREKQLHLEMTDSKDKKQYIHIAKV